MNSVALTAALKIKKEVEMNDARVNSLSHTVFLGPISTVYDWG
jgi:hypothetical protein